MELQQDHYVSAVHAQIELFDGLTERLDDWSNLIIAGNHESLVETLASNDLGRLLDSVQNSRSALKMLRQHQPQTKEKRQAQLELENAHQRLVYANTQLRLLVNRGILFTRTMLNALAGDAAENSVYDVNAASAPRNSNYVQGDA
jgi:hypothetical protein